MNTKPYCYLLGWPEQDRWYYGVRYAKNCDPSDLFVTYFTSSKHVKKFIEEHGQPTVRVIRKTFKSDQINEAREWEHRVLRRMGVPKNQKFLNKTHNKSRPALYGDDNPSKLPENREKIRIGTIKNTPRGDNHPMKNPEIAEKIASQRRGKSNWWSKGDLNPGKRPEIRKLNSERQMGANNSFYGKTHTPETIEILKQKVECPYCNKTGGKSIMQRWHFNNCRHKS